MTADFSSRHERASYGVADVPRSVVSNRESDEP
jgi:hypothetical protein